MIINLMSNINNFSFNELINVITNPTSIGIIFSLIVIESLLSIDNMLVLAMMVEHLPQKKRKRALFYGVIGAYVFRFVAIALGTLIINLWWVKLIGSLYLLWISIGHLIFKKKTRKKSIKKKESSFWKTVLAIELVDMMFSLDSIITALGISSVFWILLIGSIISIFLIRFIAGVLVTFVEKHREYEKTAYVIIGFVAIKMLLSMINIDISEEIFIAILFMLLFGTFILKKLNKNSK